MEGITKQKLKKKKITNFFFRVRDKKMQLVGKVHCYFAHVHCGETRFLAVAEVMKKHDIDEFKVTFVHMPKPGEFKRYTIFDVADILQQVGLVQYGKSEYTFKVIWPYCVYDDNIGGREPGDISHI